MCRLLHLSASAVAMTAPCVGAEGAHSCVGYLAASASWIVANASCGADAHLLTVKQVGALWALSALLCLSRSRHCPVVLYCSPLRLTAQTIVPSVGGLDLLSFAQSLTPPGSGAHVGGFRPNISNQAVATVGWRWADATPAGNLNCGFACGLWATTEPK